MSLSIRRDERIEQLIPEGEAEIYDFSKGGAGLFLDRQLNSGEIYPLHVTVGKLSLTVKAKVAHATVAGKRFRTGFQFQDVKSDAAIMLREMSNQYSRGVGVKIEVP